MSPGHHQPLMLAIQLKRCRIGRDPASNPAVQAINGAVEKTDSTARVSVSWFHLVEAPVGSQRDAAGWWGRRICWGVGLMRSGRRLFGRFRPAGARRCPGRRPAPDGRRAQCGRCRLRGPGPGDDPLRPVLPPGSGALVGAALPRVGVRPRLGPDPVPGPGVVRRADQCLDVTGVGQHERGVTAEQLRGAVAPPRHGVR